MFIEKLAVGCWERFSACRLRVKITKLCLVVLDMPLLTCIHFTRFLCMYLQFRVVAANDFAKEMTWPELVPAFKTAIQNSDLVNVRGASELKTLNVLMGLQTIIKPYKVAVLPCCQRWI